MSKRILCYGDSNTWGYTPGARIRQENRWTVQLQEMLGSDYQVIEEGLNGRTTVFYDPVEDIMSGIDYVIPCYESQYPVDVLVFMLGTNDLKQHFSVDPSAIAIGMERIIKAVRNYVNSFPERYAPKILVMSPILIDKTYENNDVMRALFGPGAVEKSMGLSAAYQEMAERNGCDFLDAAMYANAAADGVHMNAENHGKLAKAIAGKIREMI